MAQQRIVASLEQAYFVVDLSLATNALCVDQAFFIAQLPCKVVGISYIHATAGTDSGAVNVQVTKDTGTDAPGAGTDLLTNNTNAGFNCKGTINVLQTGALVTAEATRTLAAGERLSVDFAGTTAALAGVTLSVRLQYV